MFGRRPNSNQARICVLGFSANRVWLVSRFYIFLPMSDAVISRCNSPMQSDAVISQCSIGANNNLCLSTE